MDLTKNAISKYQTNIIGLNQYLLVVKEIEDNKILNPDISIDSCKSLIEGLCKKALSLISDEYNTNKSFKKQCEKFDKLLDNTFNKVFKEAFEVDLIKSFSKILYQKNKTNELILKSSELSRTNTINAVNAIVKLRDTRGDISHGRLYPKLTTTSYHLMNSIIGITDSICSYLIIEMSLRYFEKLEHETKVNELKDYRSNSDFNHWLNESLDFEFPVKKTSYSRVLFDNDFDLYQEIYFDEYYPNLNILDSKDKNLLSDLIFNLQNNKKSLLTEDELENIRIIEEKNQFEKLDNKEIESIEVIIDDEIKIKGEFIYKIEFQETIENKINEFVERFDLKIDPFKDIVDDYIRFDTFPREYQIEELPQKNIKLLERKEVLNSLMENIKIFLINLRK